MASHLSILCLIETGYPELESMVETRRMNFIQKFIRNSSGEEPLARALNLCRNTTAARLEEALQRTQDPVEANVADINRKCEIPRKMVWFIGV